MLNGIKGEFVMRGEKNVEGFTVNIHTLEHSQRAGLVVAVEPRHNG